MRVFGTVVRYKIDQSLSTLDKWKLEKTNYNSDKNDTI